MSELSELINNIVESREQQLNNIFESHERLLKTYIMNNFNKISKENEELKNENKILKKQLKKDNLLINELKEKVLIPQKVIESANINNPPVHEFYYDFNAKLIME
jgi:hypothetical protein